MKLRSLIIDIISILFIIPFYYLTKDNNIFLYTLSLYLYLILSSIFSHIDIYSNIKNYYDNKYIYSLNTIFKYTNITIIIINILISIIISIFSLLFNKLFNIPGFIIVNIIMSLTLFITPILKNITSFVRVYNFKTLSENLINIYKIINLILLIITSILAFKVFNLPTYIAISLLYICNIISFLITYLLVDLLVLSIKIKKKQFKKKEERINYKKEIKTILSNNINISIVNIIKYGYFYISIILLYFVLGNSYGYSYEKVSNIINNCYLYSFGLINIIVLITKYINNDKITLLKNKDTTKQNIRLDDYLINKFKILLTIIVISSVTSDALWTIIFNNDNGYIFYMYNILNVFYIIYTIITDISINNINNKKLYLILLSGLIIKLLFTVPFISSLYRMGYNLLYGDMLSSVISYFISLSLLLIAISPKFNIDFIKKFDRILDIIYYNILLCVILLAFTLIIPVKVSSRLEGLKVIIIYLLISIIYMIIRKKMKKNERNNF